MVVPGQLYGTGPADGGTGSALWYRVSSLVPGQLMVVPGQLMVVPGQLYGTGSALWYRAS
jgi:hypothetical protein